MLTLQATVLTIVVLVAVLLVYVVARGLVTWWLGRRG